MNEKMKPPKYLIEKHADLLQRMVVCMAKAEIKRRNEGDLFERKEV